LVIFLHRVRYQQHNLALRAPDRLPSLFSVDYPVRQQKKVGIEKYGSGEFKADLCAF
jgi:hypothetical protein